MKMPGFVTKEHDAEFVKELEAYKYPDTYGRALRNMRAERVCHDHRMDGVYYFLVNWQRGYRREGGD